MSEADPEFVFISDVLALDLVNTVKVVRGKEQDLLQIPTHVAQWWSLAQAHHPHMDIVRGKDVIFDANLFTAVKMVRDSLRHLLLQVIANEAPDTATITLLNDVLRLGHPVLEWHAHDAPSVTYEHEGSTQGGLLLPIALSALHLLTQMDLTRLHKCRNQRCILLFYDTTKSGTRQFCSTACLDRERSLLRYEQKKKSTQP